MANHKSALKRQRQNEKRRLHNRIYRSRARTFVKNAREEISGGDLEAAREATRLAVRDLDMAASRGTIHKNNAARRKKPSDETACRSGSPLKRRVITFCDGHNLLSYLPACLSRLFCYQAFMGTAESVTGMTSSAMSRR